MINIAKVPKIQWKRWSKKARSVFNGVYSTMMGSQDLFKHPEDTSTKKEIWRTTAWNAAWVAADSVDETE